MPRSPGSGATIACRTDFAVSCGPSHDTGAEALQQERDLDRFLSDVEKRALRIAEISVRDRDEALDLVQDAMIKLVRRYAQRSAEEWTPLFYRILQNGVRDWHRTLAGNVSGGSGRSPRAFRDVARIVDEQRELIRARYQEFRDLSPEERDRVRASSACRRNSASECANAFATGRGSGSRFRQGDF
jgi:DNA-directed RNA polymerase specialized sigma24 family protein